ncbi:MAG: hemerythrin domain-containing protein [Actinobacteria bacterium]|nr:hemerythrin domain-containing protein [Actinomycetota bacterium]
MEPIDVIELLERDHRMLDELVAELDDAEDTDAIRHVFLRIVEALSAHEVVEHDVLYPAYRAAFGADDDETLSHRMAEHEELNELLAEMRGLAPDGFAFLKRGSALLLEMQGHFQAEEETVFARMRRDMSPELLADLGRQAVVAKSHAPVFPGNPRTLTAS